MRDTQHAKADDHQVLLRCVSPFMPQLSFKALKCFGRPKGRAAVYFIYSFMVIQVPISGPKYRNRREDYGLLIQ